MMASPGERPLARKVKTETLSLRLDPKTKFVLEFMSRLRGQSITTLVERAIKSYSDDVTVGGIDARGFGYELNWTHFWDPSEGVRTLKLLAEAGYPSSFEDDELRQFTLDHWQFFYNNANGNSVNRTYVEILWSNMSEYLTCWREKRSTNNWAAGHAMAKAIAAAQVAPPKWPPKTIPADLDDDIPF